MALRRFIFSPGMLVLPEAHPFARVINIGDVALERIVLPPQKSVERVSNAASVGTLTADTLYIIYCEGDYQRLEVESCELILRLLKTRNGSFVIVQGVHPIESRLPDWPKNLADADQLRHDYTVIEGEIVPADDIRRSVGERLMLSLKMTRLPFVVRKFVLEPQHWLVCGPGPAANRDKMAEVAGGADLITVADYTSVNVRPDAFFAVTDLEADVAAPESQVLGRIKRIMNGHGSLGPRNLIICCRYLSTVNNTMIVQPGATTVYRIVSDRSKSPNDVSLMLEAM
jgi:hypothetical protein